MTQDPRKQRTRQQLHLALVALLEKKQFTEITTLQLTNTAGISRSSFYTHYRDKYEMIDDYQQSLFHKIEYIFEKSTNSAQETFLEIFEFLHREELFAALLSENGTSEIQQFLRNKVKLMISEMPFSKASHPNFSPIEREYWSVFLSHAFFGVCQTWIARGKKETPKQITDFLIKILSPI
ncbi:TetR/AcrR family transcriptional regulator C-terminal domain-containing protein [Streptococcus cameli]